jgi:ribokinase
VPRIVVAGMSNTDLVCRTPRLPAPGETIAGTSFDTYPGGKGANQAVAAARAGAEVLFVGAVGDDQYGIDRASDLQAEGIDLHALQKIDDVHSGVALIWVDDHGLNSIVTVAGANGQVEPEIARQRIDAYPHDLLLMTWELHPETSTAILGAASSSAMIVLNAAPFDATVIQVLEDDRLVLVCNEVEASQILGRDVDEENAALAVASLQQRGCRAAVITLGAAGAVASSGGQHFQVAAPPADVIDTTGAGDTFCGVFATWLAEGASMELALRAGVHAGTLATMHHGAQPSIPRRDAVESSLSSNI